MSRTVVSVYLRCSHCNVLNVLGASKFEKNHPRYVCGSCGNDLRKVPEDLDDDDYESGVKIVPAKVKKL